MSISSFITASVAINTELNQTERTRIECESDIERERFRRDIALEAEETKRLNIEMTAQQIFSQDAYAHTERMRAMDLMEKGIDRDMEVFNRICVLAEHNPELAPMLVQMLSVRASGSVSALEH